MDISVDTAESISPNGISPLKLLEGGLGPERIRGIWSYGLPRAYRFWVNYSNGAQSTGSDDIGEQEEEINRRLSIAYEYSNGRTSLEAIRSAGLDISKTTAHQIIHRVEKLLGIVLNDEEKAAIGFCDSKDPGVEWVAQVHDKYTGLQDTLIQMAFSDSNFDSLLDRNPHFQIFTHFLQEGYSLTQILNSLGISALSPLSIKLYSQGLTKALVCGEVTRYMKTTFMRHIAFANFLETDADCRGNDPGYRVAETIRKAGEGCFVSSRKEGPAMRELAIFARMLPSIHYYYLTREDAAALPQYMKSLFPGAKINGRFDVGTVDSSRYISQFIGNRGLRYGKVPEPFYFLAMDIISGATLKQIAYGLKRSGVPYTSHMIRSALGIGMIFFENMLLARESFLDLSMEEQKAVIKRYAVNDLVKILGEIAENVRETSTLSSSSQPSHIHE